MYGVVSAKGRNRTDDTSIFSAVLYQLSYLGFCTNEAAYRLHVPHYNTPTLLRQSPFSSRVYEIVVGKGV